MSSQQNGLVAGNSQNEAGGVSLRNRSTFPLSYSFFETERFAEYTPFYVQEGVSGDRLPLHSRHELRTYTLQSPLMQSLLKKKDFFYVPMQAILPLNWEKFYTNPVIGEDVPEDTGTGVQGFWNKLYSNFVSDYNTLEDYLDIQEPVLADVYSVFLRFCVFYEMFYSTGSLMETLGISGHNYIVLRILVNGQFIRKTFDEFFDEVISTLFDFGTYRSLRVAFHIGADNYVIVHPDDVDIRSSNDYRPVSIRSALELLRDNLSDFEVDSVSLPNNNTVASDIYSVYGDWSYASPFLDANDGSELVPLNTARLWAYQLVCAHFYSNDHVDFVYSAELFRQRVWELFATSINNLTLTKRGFSVNGLTYEYDALSAYVSSHFLSFLLDDNDNLAIAYWQSMLSFKRSLRFMDYFSGSRTLPLAVGDTSVDASSGLVDVLDLSRQRMMAKFLLAVNRSGRKFGAYMQELFGKVPKPDYHNPFYLAHTSDVVGSSENENTAEGQRAQNAITSNLRTNADRYAFMFEPDRDCVVLGISYYDIPRVYGNATERQNFYLDRFDMFNPYMQYIGDQAIYRAEIGTDEVSLLPFSYTNRHMEYKQRFNQCAGGFLVPSTQLGTWIFQGDKLYRWSLKNLSPSFIRSFNEEFDRFYTSLTGYSLGTYFHFIVRYDNRMDATRPMAYAPQID